MSKAAEGLMDRHFLALFFLALSSLITTSCQMDGSAEPTPVINTHSEGDILDGSMGQVETLTFKGGHEDINFSGRDNYLLTINSTSPDSDDISMNINSTLNTALGVRSTALQTAPTEFEEEFSSQFHQYLREMESVYRESDQFQAVESPAISSASALTLGGTNLEVGETGSFRVLSTMNSITVYNDVNATLRLATPNLYVFVDNQNASHISDDDLAALAHNFEDVALPRERNLFGQESDINGDGHITILMTCTVNRMATSGGIVTGFFFPGDLYQRSSINPVSNTQEIFYTLVPDPDGECGTPISSEFAVGNLLPGVLAHEYQHMTSFNQHVFVNQGSTEEPWLNECLSHIAEDITGFGHENPSRVRLFLSQTSRTPIIPPSSPTLAERGGCYTFLRYLYEQNPDGDQFLRNLFNSPRTGVENLEIAYNVAAASVSGIDSSFDEFPEFMNRWALALAFSETGMTEDPRYNYEPRIKDTNTDYWTGLCIRCDTEDGRGTTLNGPGILSIQQFPSVNIMKPTAVQFYQFNIPTNSIQLTTSQSAPITGSLVQVIPE